MPYTTLVSTGELALHLTDPGWSVVDCRFDLTQPAWGEAQYRAAHLPGAVYAHLDRDLSGPKTGKNGRHPLPVIEQFTARLGAWGIERGMQAVAYDQSHGMWASRLWWLLRYLGHDAVAVLDGGFGKWLGEARPTHSGAEARAPRTFTGEPHGALLVDGQQVEQLRSDPAYRLIDSRAPERYRGEIEPIDPVAGHIPGAVNLYNLSNVNPDGTFLAPDSLRAKFQALLGGVPPENAVTYCGSGVAAAHTVLAMEAAGMRGAKVYAGSWSEWCADQQRPVSTGNQP
jgi:thiosulfate/3-mercaptopyruvate sulfurtransferase